MNFIKKIKNRDIDLDFLKIVFTMAIPIAFQNLISSSINLADVFMIGKLGEVSLAALGISNQIAFLMLLLIYGINSGSAIFISQLWGKGEKTSIYKPFNIALVGSLIITSFFFLLVQFNAEKILSIYSKDPEVIRVASEYIKIVSYSYLFTGTSFAFALKSRSIGKPKPGLYASVLALTLNVILNYLLIFGNFNFPALGVKGAAYATLIARFFECAAIFTLFFPMRREFGMSYRKLLNFDSEFTKAFARTTAPVMLNELLWAIGITSYSIIYARMNTSSIAVINIVGSIEKVAFPLFVGIASATSVIIGNKIGEGREDLAIIYSKKLIGIAVTAGVSISFLLLLASKSIVNFYNLESQINLLTLYTIYAACFILPIRACNVTIIIGLLRAGGDTKSSLILEVASLWLVGLPLAFLGGFQLAFPVYLVFLMASSEEIFKFILGLRRIASKRWIKNLVSDL